MISYTLSHEGKDYKFYIPEKVLDCFNDEFDYRFIANCQELTDMAVAIFVGLLDTPNVATGGSGGGSQSDLPWRDKDEDDLQCISWQLNLEQHFSAIFLVRLRANARKPSEE